MNQSIPNQQGQTSRGNLCQYCFKWLSKKCLLYYEFQNIEYQVSNGFSLADFGSLCSRKTRWTLISYSLEILGSDWLELWKMSLKLQAIFFFDDSVVGTNNVLLSEVLHVNCSWSAKNIVIISKFWFWLADTEKNPIWN